MKPFHILLAVLVAVIWGVAFVVSKIGLESFTPSQLTSLRFMVAGIAAVWLPRPRIRWSSIIAVGLTVFTGQFLLQFFGIALGMPAGLTAVVVQTQALFTVLFAALAIGDRPSAQQLAGMLTGFAGVILISSTVGGSITFLGFSLTLASAVSWAIGNVLVKQLPKVDMLHLMVWASLVPPLPALAISSILDGPGAIIHALTVAPLMGIAAPIYLGVFASVLAYAVWGSLLQRYSTGAVAPFALLAPCVGAAMSALVLGEHFGPLRLAGIACMLVGLAVVAIPFSAIERQTLFVRLDVIYRRIKARLDEAHPDSP
ncbi:EamA family transporter [Bradyrhizobium sp.]|uniref:EamA family transporter n=1 Tax=Bradyrhizobium sp. TaxID=376 RepID=UPI002D439EB3|nr:EamA family transporter [Bradyrhizobium sp.]HZR73478.1 EamA family transporter [Bradyrhizobium sp.]